MKKGVLVAAAAIFLIGSVIAVGVLKYGIVPVNADVPPSALEMRIFPAALRASVARRAGAQPAPAPSSDENLIAGAEVYREMCARCHGLPGKGPSVLGSSFYPLSFQKLHLLSAIPLQDRLATGLFHLPDQGFLQIHLQNLLSLCTGEVEKPPYIFLY